MCYASFVDWRFHVKHCLLAWAGILGAGLVACTVPDDTVFTPPTSQPIAEGGRFRLTLNPGSDVVRGFRPDGRIVYRSFGMAPVETQWRILSLSPSGGPAREEAAPYRTALLHPFGQLTFDQGGRVLTLWRPAFEGIQGCGPPAPAPPTVIELAVLRLEATDGQPVSAIRTRALDLAVVEGTGTLNRRVWLTPAELEIRGRGGDPFGPATGSDGVGFVSDGANLWRIDVDDPGAAAQLVGPGVFPSLSGDGTMLAAAVPARPDTTITVTSVPLGFFICVQETITISPGGWQVLIYDLPSGVSRVLGPGVEPRFDLSANRLLVRREALYWVDLASGAEQVIPGTEGAYSPALAPDGSIIAFSVTTADGRDVFFIRR
jgi:hypothetical protein